MEDCSCPVAPLQILPDAAILFQAEFGAAEIAEEFEEKLRAKTPHIRRTRNSSTAVRVFIRAVASTVVSCLSFTLLSSLPLL